MTLVRRILIFGACCLLLSACSQNNAELGKQTWQTYKSRFIDAEGRVIDTGNANISHSEGQGYGMLLAVEYDDHETFQKLWQWTQANLQVRNDKLFIWRKRPNVDLKDEDPNNASDGDMLIAWSLLKAEQRWQQADYRTEALAILADIKQKLIISWHDLTILLPGADGFVKNDGYIVNLSYWIFPALQTFAVLDSDSIWQRLSDSGLTLLQNARYGRWQLPPDWLHLAADHTMQVANQPRFGYDAVRIPLYLAWANKEPQTLTKFADYWSFYQGYTPAWIDLNENFIDGYGASAGINAIKQLTLWRSGRNQNILLPPLNTDQDYYSSSLLLLSQLATQKLQANHD